MHIISFKYFKKEFSLASPQYFWCVQSTRVEYNKTSIRGIPVSEYQVIISLSTFAVVLQFKPINGRVDYVQDRHHDSCPEYDVAPLGYFCHDDVSLKRTLRVQAHQAPGFDGLRGWTFFSGCYKDVHLGGSVKLEGPFPRL